MAEKAPVAGQKIKRMFMAHYIDASAPGNDANYVRLGEDLEEYNVELNANINTKNNILGATTVVLDSYQPQASAEPYYAVVGDPLFERLQNIIDERQTLDDLKTTVVEVHLWEEGGTSGTYVAYQEEAIIEVSSYGGDTTGYQIPFNVHHTGTRKKGNFTLSTKTFAEE